LTAKFRHRRRGGRARQCIAAKLPRQPPPLRQRAAHLGDDLEDLVNLLLKVHVQQAVRLVQHQVAQALRCRTKKRWAQ